MPPVSLQGHRGRRQPGPRRCSPTTVSAALNAAEAGAGIREAIAGDACPCCLPGPARAPASATRRRAIRIRSYPDLGRARYLCYVRSAGDRIFGPSVMLGETALCLALDTPPAHRAGFLPLPQRWVPRLAALLRSAVHTLTTRQITIYPLGRASWLATWPLARRAFAAGRLNEINKRFRAVTYSRRRAEVKGEPG